jgi:ribulose-5-phosphate 4-epimerase/fuculose-1-phosphate aldolase
MSVMETDDAVTDVRAQVSVEEWRLRVELAACYRMIAHLGWDDLIFTHISARVPGPDAHFLLNPYGMMFEEVTASSLVKIDLEGNKLLPSPFDIIPAGFVIHSAVHAARPDAHCVMHLHTPAGVAVSAQKGGLLPISQTALYALASLAYHPYEGVALDEAEKPRLQAALGKARMMILENHGLLTTGRSVAEAFLSMFTLQRACEVQVMAQAGGGAALNAIAPGILKGIAAQARQSLGDSGADRVWPAIMRKMDRLNPDYRA